MHTHLYRVPIVSSTEIPTYCSGRHKVNSIGARILANTLIVVSCLVVALSGSPQLKSDQVGQVGSNSDEKEPKEGDHGRLVGDAKCEGRYPARLP